MLMLSVVAVRRSTFWLALAVLLSTAAFAASVTNIDQMSGWESCTSCAGSGGSGPQAYYSVWIFQSSPSLDGASARFNLAGSTPYSNALWWKQLTPSPGAHNFQYDFWVYLTNSSAPQALEFDVNQSVNGKKFIFGTECDFKYLHVWKLWDSYNGTWVPTGVGCAPFQAYSWNHFILEFQRTWNDQVFFIDIVINGQRYYFNRTFQPKHGIDASELNVAVQLDGDYRQTPYSVWVDKITLNYW
ncbi:MAG TPA: hypothetical protein VE734_01725 [Terriglobales bacterium]|jgi:hypothetical protein|nr:hypothetical protein [Terriglobales bacterium]